MWADVTHAPVDHLVVMCKGTTCLAHGPHVSRIGVCIRFDFFFIG